MANRQLVAEKELNQQLVKEKIAQARQHKRLIRQLQVGRLSASHTHPPHTRTHTHTHTHTRTHTPMLSSSPHSHTHTHTLTHAHTPMLSSSSPHSTHTLTFRTRCRVWSSRWVLWYENLRRRERGWGRIITDSSSRPGGIGRGRKREGRREGGRRGGALQFNLCVGECVQVSV